AEITEVVVQHYARTSGSSKYGLERVLKVLADLITVKFLDRYQQKPMYLFGAAGLAFLIISVLSGFFAIFLKCFAVPSRSFIETPMPCITAVAGVVGVICIIRRLLAGMIVRTLYESHGKSVYLVKATKNIEGTK